MKLKDLIGIVPDNEVINFSYYDGYVHTENEPFKAMPFKLWNKEIKSISTNKDILEGGLNIEFKD